MHMLIIYNHNLLTNHSTFERGGCICNFFQSGQNLICQKVVPVFNYFSSKDIHIFYLYYGSEKGKILSKTSHFQPPGDEWLKLNWWFAVFCEIWPTIQLLKEVGVFIFVKVFFSKWKGIDIQKSIRELFSLKGYGSFCSFFWLWKMKYC